MTAFQAKAARPTAAQRLVATAPAPAARRPIRVPLPRTWPVIGVDVVWVLGLNAALILAMWVRHGGLDDLGAPGAILTAVGQVAGLYAAYLSLIQLVLMSRSPWVEQVFGMDRLAWAHRWLGFATVWLIVAHGIFIVTGYAIAERQGIPAELWTLVTTYEWVLPATIGGLLFVGVGLTSMKMARRRLAYDDWFLIHLLAYVAIALGFLHQLFVGADFMHDGLARAYWISLFVIAFALILGFRFGAPIVLNARHRFRVARVAREGPGLTSIYVTGRDLDRLPVRSGQFFVWRFLAGRGWWHAHPFSLSSAPNGEWLRITVKALGDDTRSLQRLPIGTRVLAEGPYGVLTGARRRRRKILLIAGGIGIAPLRALVESLPAQPGEMILLYRAREPRHIVFRDELDTLARLRGIDVHYLVGRRGSPELPKDPLEPRALRTLVPDIKDRDVYLCGPIPMMDRLEATLGRLGLPRRHIHAERFAY